jgi:hypothetical protein
MSGSSKGFSKRLAMSAFDATKIGAWERDADGGVLRCDPMAAQLWGFSPNEAAQGACIDRLRSAIHPDDRCIFFGRHLCVTTHGSILMSEYRVTPAPGDVRWVLVRGHYQARRPGQAFAGGRGVVMDITNCRPAIAPACRWSNLSECEEHDDPLHRATDRALALYADVEAMGEEGQAILTATRKVLFLLGRQLSSGTSLEELESTNRNSVH